MLFFHIVAHIWKSGGYGIFIPSPCTDQCATWITTGAHVPASVYLRWFHPVSLRHSSSVLSTNRLTNTADVLRTADILIMQRLCWKILTSTCFRSLQNMGICTWKRKKCRKGGFPCGRALAELMLIFLWIIEGKIKHRHLTNINDLYYVIIFFDTYDQKISYCWKYFTTCM